MPADYAENLRQDRRLALLQTLVGAPDYTAHGHLLRTALEAFGTQELASRVDFAAMTDADIYPGFWDEQDVFYDWLRPAYKRLRKFYRRAARSQSAVLVAIL